MLVMLVAPAFCQTSSNSVAGTGLLFNVGNGGLLVNDQSSSTAAFTAIIPNRITSASTGRAESTSLILGPAFVATNTFSGSATSSTGRRLSQTTSAASTAGTTFNFNVGAGGLAVSDSASTTNAFTLRFRGNVLVGTSGRAAQFILAVGPASGTSSTNSASSTTTGRKLKQNTAANTGAGTFAATFVGTGGAAFVQETSASGAISIRQPGFVVSAAGSRAAILTVIVGPASGVSGTNSFSNTQGSNGRKLSQATTSAGIGINVNTAVNARAGQFAATINRVRTVSGSISAGQGGPIPVDFSFVAGFGLGTALVVG